MFVRRSSGVLYGSELPVFYANGQCLSVNETASFDCQILFADVISSRNLNLLDPGDISSNLLSDVSLSLDCYYVSVGAVFPNCTSEFPAAIREHINVWRTQLPVAPSDLRLKPLATTNILNNRCF
ncbi:hypothetical protein ACJJTC_016145 [Scirpophaga incertulas]